MTTPFDQIDEATAERLAELRLNVTTGPQALSELMRRLGTGRLAGMFLRGLDVVYTPRENENGYVPLTHVELDHDGPAQIRRVTPTVLAARVDISYEVFRETRNDGDRGVLFPEEVAKRVLALAEEVPNLRRLREVVHTPVLRRDGSVLDKPGYDAASGALYLPTERLDVPPIPAKPSRAEIHAARDLLLKPVAQFDFVTEDDRANYVGMLLTPFLRTQVPPPYKLGLINAPMPGSGKTLLANLTRILHGGVFRAEMPENDAELRKQVTAILGGTTAPVIHIDNVSGTLSSSTLAGLLTSAVWDDRTLGKNELVTCVNDRLWVMTGNNIKLGGDLQRRSVCCTIDPRVPNPHLRTHFEIRDLETWMRVHRGQLIAAALTLVRAWLDAGGDTTHDSTDSYSRWQGAVTHILETAELPGTFGALGTALGGGLTGSELEWHNLLAEIHDRWGSESWTAKDIINAVSKHAVSVTPDGITAVSIGERRLPEEALPTALAEKYHKAGGNGASAATNSLRQWLRNWDGRYAGVYTARKSHTEKREVFWAVERYEVSPDNSGQNGQ